MKVQSDRRALNESRIKTSAPAAATEEVISGVQAETPHTSKSPLLLRSLARDSRNNRFPATKNTVGLVVKILLPGYRVACSTASLISQILRQWQNSILLFVG